MPKRKPDIGQILIESLTSDQVAGLLTVLSASKDFNVLIDKVEKLDPDTADTVKRAMDMDKGAQGRGKAKPLASAKRTMEYWRSLWRNWNEILSQVGIEEGKYAVQDHHWEPPYFDGWSLARDLEPIAEDMLALIDDVYHELDQPDLFSDALWEIEENISSYPDWMGVEHGEPCFFEEKVTRCVLNWLWLSSNDERFPGQILVKKVCDIENTFEMVALDNNAFTNFFAGLPDGICWEIYEFLKEGDYDLDLADTYSAWHHINLAYEKKFDAGAYLKTCRAHLNERWVYGRPLVDDALKHNDFKKAESFLIKTFSSYLKGCGGKKWFPETSLLLTEASSTLGEDNEKVSELLGTWAHVSKSMNNLARSAAAAFQSVTFRTPEKWEKVLKEFKRLSKLDTQKILSRLLTQWKAEMASRSYPYYLEPHKISDTWIHWLIDAKLAVRGSKKMFIAKLMGWMADLKNDSNKFKKEWHWLARLTKDLPNSRQIQAKHPLFWNTVLSEKTSRDDLTASRCKGLMEMKAGSCMKTTLEVWKKHLRKIVPDPANAYQSNYQEHSRWAQALYELNRKEYAALMSHWRRKHNRRRNLWRDLKAMHLPID